MAPGWQSKLARVSHMSWDEIHTRLGQEVTKRSDALLYGGGKRRPGIEISRVPTRQGRFFFAATETPERVELIRTHLPADAAAIISEADDICRHHFHLLGYDNLDYGTEIDWHVDRVHGKRAPLVPWPRVPFLEFAAVGDHKVTWELNRHQHLVTLAKASLLSHDKKYLCELRAQWQSWIQANPYPLGINWASTLEVAFRAHSWVWIDQLLSGAPGHDEFHASLVPELAWHGRYIERFLSTYFSPNTHLLGEAVVLLLIASVYPQISASERWQQAAWKVVLQEAKRQVRPDGVYFEQSLHYHVYALDFFLYARLLAARNGLEVPAEFDSTLNRMLDVVQALSQAGPPEGFGDDDGGRVFNPRRNQTEHMTDPLTIGAVLYQRNDLSAAHLTEESLWLFGSQAAAASQSKPPTPQPAAFPDGGLYVLTDSEACPQQLVVDAGPQGVGRCGHGHADALSIRLAVDGQRWIVDSGTGVYISGDPADRNALRGTAAHNTMRVDGADQALAADPFSWTAIPNTRVENWQAGSTFSYFAGSHDGYTRLSDPVIHSRHIVKIGGGPFLIRDVAQGQREHDMEIFWHFAPELEIEQNGSVISIPSERTADASHRAFHLIVPDQTPWRLEVTRGLLSPAYGRYQPAPLVRAHARVALPAELATVLSMNFGTQRGESPRLASMRHSAVQVYELAEADVNHGFCFALDKRPWNFGPWFSDAEFLYCRIQQERLVHLIVVGGTYVSWQKQPLLKATSPCAFFEWREQGGVLNSQPEPFTLFPLFQELTRGGSITRELSNAASSTGGEKH